jgi:5,10-methylenetetrahydrofolate reductase
VGPAGAQVSPAAPFLIGVAEAPGVDPSGGARLEAKVAAGARFVQTQPVYDLAGFQRWLERMTERGLTGKAAILAGVLPPRSAAQLERFAALPGWSVPEATLARLRGAADQRVEGIALAVEMVERLRALPGLRGVHLMGLGPDSGVPEVVEAAGLLPRPLP